MNLKRISLIVLLVLMFFIILVSVIYGFMTFTDKKVIAFTDLTNPNDSYTWLKHGLEIRIHYSAKSPQGIPMMQVSQSLDIGGWSQTRPGNASFNDFISTGYVEAYPVSECNSEYFGRTYTFDCTPRKVTFRRISATEVELVFHHSLTTYLLVHMDYVLRPNEFQFWWLGRY